MATRRKSPYLELKPGISKSRAGQLDFYQIIQNKDKIHRIRTKHKFEIEVTHITSPSEVWVRPIHHIADKLTVPFSNTLKLEEKFKMDSYVLTPNFDAEDKILIRARILSFDDSQQKYLLRLIDHGKPVLRFAKDIYQLEFKLEKDDSRFYPWQTICCALQGIKPMNGEEWRDEEVVAIQKTLTEFSSFFLQPTFHEIAIVNDDSFPLQATILGINDEDRQSDNKDDKFRSGKSTAPEVIGYSIADLYLLHLPSIQPASELSSKFSTKNYFHYPREFEFLKETES